MPRQATYAFMSVKYDHVPDDPVATRAGYKSVNLRVEYGKSYAERRVFATGDFTADYTAAVDYVHGLPGSDRFPFMASSSVDDFFHDAAYETYTAEEVAMVEAEQVALDAWQTEPEPGPAEGRYEVAFSVDTGPVFANLTEDQRADLQAALNTVQALLYAAGGPTNEFAADAVQRLECALDFPPGTDLSENERRAQAASEHHWYVDEGETGWQAACDCGWTSKQSEQRLAEVAAKTHAVVAAQFEARRVHKTEKGATS